MSEEKATVRSLGPRGLGATLSGHIASVSPVAQCFGLPPVDWNAPKVFSFSRRKRDGVWGWEIGLNVGSFWMNLHCGSLDPAPYLPTLDEARGWAIDFADRHGFKAMERKREPRRKPRPALRVLPGGSRASLDVEGGGK